MTLKSSDWCVPDSASNLPTWDTMPESIYVSYSEDLQSGEIFPGNEPGTLQTFKATTENINYQYARDYSDVRTEATPTTLVDSTSDPIKVYEYVDAQHIAVTSDSSWVEGKAYFVPAHKGK